MKIVDGNGDTTTIHRNADGSGIIVNAKGDTTALKGRETIVVDQKGNTIWQSNTPQEIMIAKSNTNNSANGRTGISFFGKQYYDKDTIYVTHSNLTNVPIHFFKDTLAIPFDSVTWTGISKVDSFHVNIANILVTGKSVKSFYKRMQTEIIFKLNKVVFFRLSDGLNGNVFGYDDYDRPNDVSSHHISIQKEKMTYLGISFRDTTSIKIVTVPSNLANCRIINNLGNSIIEIEAQTSSGEGIIAATSKVGLNK